MTDDDRTDGFLARWSSRKHAARREEDPVAAEPAESAPPAEDSPAPCGGEPERPVLPDLETLDGTSDYRGFLDRAVPRELRVAALRKAWASDPVIAGYRPLADYDWDFNAPGYAALKPTDDPSKFIGALFRHLRPPEPVAAAGEAGAADVHMETADAVEVQDESQPGLGGPEAEEESQRAEPAGAPAAVNPAGTARS